jgi:hypothetical protein
MPAAAVSDLRRRTLFAAWRTQWNAVLVVAGCALDFKAVAGVVEAYFVLVGAAISVRSHLQRKVFIFDTSDF